MCEPKTRGGAVWVALAFAWASPAGADLQGADHAIRGGHFPAGASAALASPSHAGTGAAGQGEPVGFVGFAGGDTLAPGFVPLLAGAMPHLDGDGDGLAFFLDDDDDGDGLLDEAETDTGAFVSANDTGTDSLLADSDGDGVWDGIEVLLGFDPNDPESVPPLGAVPGLGGLGRVLASMSLAFAGVWAWRRRVARAARADGRPG